MKISQEFEKFGGDVQFLYWLSLSIEKQQRPRVRTRELERSQKLAQKLRNSFDAPTVRRLFPETQQLTLALISLEIRLALTARSEDIREENLLGRLLLPPKKSPGHPLERADIHAWLGALVPYTAFCRGGKPRWVWIDHWLEYKGFAISKGESQKFWSKAVVRRWRETGSLDHDLAILLESASKEYPLYLSVIRGVSTPPEKRRLTAMETRYRLARKHHLRFLK